ncbi:MAG: LamG-like jellyroll fold domain-containing protein [Planctomycetota bacterium]|jgi:hypothetical protein
MYKKFIRLVCFILVLGMVNTSGANAADSNLVGWWKFDEGSGDIATDSSGNEFDIPLLDHLWADGVFGGAVVFPGQGQGQKGEFVYNENAITVCVWVWHEAFIANQVERYVTAEPEIAVIRKESDGRLHFYINAGGSLRHLRVSDVLTEGQWQHVAGTWDGQTQRLYLDGVEIASQTPGGALGTTSGVRFSNTPEPLNGMLDDARIYTRALTQEEINIVMVGPEYPYASNPSPADGSLYGDTWVSLNWREGDFAVSHDVYFGDIFDDVNDATPDSDVFRGNQGLGIEFFIAGFFGYPYPDGLVSGTTYYWRIDEVNNADPNSPWKGKVWSFTIPPKKAYEPVPGDGSKFIDSENLTLQWTPGFGAMLHTVYFGDDYETIANATGGTSQGSTTFNPGPLETEKTYYWRVDEFETGGTHKGDVWSFTTAKVGGGLRAEYYHWSGDYPPSEPFQVFVTTEIVPEINWNWGDPGSPNALVNADDFACRFTGEIEAAFTETYTFCVTTDDGQRLWVDGQPIIDMWVQQGMVEHRGTIDLVASQRYSIELWMYEHGGGAGCELRWLSPSTPKQIIPQAALSPPVRAMGPSPTNGATGTKMTPILKWGAGVSAVSHEVYFGTDADAVANADKNSPEYKGTKALGDESFDPGKLAWFTQYFWRIDEVNDLNPDSPWIGNLWNFTTGDFIVVDDFEDYDAGDNQVWYSWIDGLGFGAPGSVPYNPGNGTGSAVGDENSPSYTEETIVHSGRKSMPLEFNNNKQGYANYSETELTLTYPRDWTEEQVAELSLWFMGYPASTGSFVEGPVGTYTMTASGADIWAVNGVEADEFHFAYKMLTGAGSIIARVDSVENTNDWAKAGVMIRETLDPDSAHAFACVTPANGVAAQGRPSTGGTSINTAEGGITAPHWVKLDRSIGGTFTVSHSTNGSTWVPVTGTTPQTIQMGTNVYIGLALTSHDAALTCQAVFSNVTTTGNVTGQWTNQDIGIESNDAEPLYVAVSNSTGAPAIVVHDDPSAAQIDTWTEWVIPLSAFADKGIVLTNVDRIAIGLGTQGNMTVPGGSGKMFFDDIRLYRSREAAE